MWSNQKQEFIEGAGRALFVSAWADHQENEVCRTCGKWPDHTFHDVDACEADGTPTEYHEFRGTTYPGADLMDVAPATPQDALYCAAELLGKLESVNGADLSAIMMNAARCEIGGEWCGDAQREWCDANARDFGHYTAMQALGHGVAWTDDHARVMLPTFDNGAETHKPLRVPYVEYEVAE